MSRRQLLSGVFELRGAANQPSRGLVLGRVRRALSRCDKQENRDEPRRPRSHVDPFRALHLHRDDQDAVIG